MRQIPPDDVRPLLATDPVWTDTGLSMPLERTVVEVDDDGGRLRRLLDACDGRRTVAELTEEFGADAHELIDGLLGAGALVDVDQAWRRFHRLGGNPAPVRLPTALPAGGLTG